MNDSSSSVYTVSSTQDAGIDSLSATVEPGKTVKFEVRLIPHASLATGSVFKLGVDVVGKLNGNDTTSSVLQTAKVTVNEGATTNVVANTTDNKLLVKPGVSTKVASFNYNVKNDSKDVTTMQLAITGIAAPTTEIDDLTIDFGGSV
jgi:hypothetical protein